MRRRECSVSGSVRGNKTRLAYHLGIGNNAMSRRRYTADLRPAGRRAVRFFSTGRGSAVAVARCDRPGHHGFDSLPHSACGFRFCIPDRLQHRQHVWHLDLRYIQRATHRKRIGLKRLYPLFLMFWVAGPSRIESCLRCAASANVSRFRGNAMSDSRAASR